MEGFEKIKLSNDVFNEYVIIEAEELCLLGDTEMKEMIRKNALHPSDDRDVMISQLIQWTDLKIQVI